MLSHRLLSISRVMFVAFALLVGCQTPKTTNSWDSKIYIKSKSDIPESYDKASKRFNEASQLILPQRTLLVSRVARPKAELRRGPGIQFKLVDAILSNKETVYLFERVGVWQKVYEPLRKVQGWVHHKVLDESVGNSKVVSLDVAQLPTVFAMTNIESVYSFPQKERFSLHIPKGAIFKSLATTEFGTLVWLHQNDTVMWIQGKAVR